MTENQLIELGFKKDMCCGEFTNAWKMPWGGAIEINENDDIHSLLLMAYKLGKTSGISKGESIGKSKLQEEIKNLLGLNQSNI